jgi:hypothetical protein
MGNHACAGKRDCGDPGVKCAGGDKDCKGAARGFKCAGHDVVVRKRRAGCPQTADRKNYLQGVPKEALAALSRPWWD